VSHHVRRPVLAGNWKMNMGPDETTSFFSSFVQHYHAREDRTVVFFPPAISVTAARQALADRPDIGIGVQNLYWEPEGAFTGETSAGMAAQAGARFALAGHSERRHVFGESDEEVGRKVAAALGAGLIPVACVGEKLDQREAGRLRDVLVRQLDAILDALPHGRADRLVLAYEPVWAIGTGVNATPADAAEAHGILRDRLAERVGAGLAAATPILYGGSVKPGNAGDLLDADGVDGLLVGGASLDPGGFARIAAV
jgi:triosephosphate isomerase (TIM)